MKMKTPTIWYLLGFIAMIVSLISFGLGMAKVFELDDVMEKGRVVILNEEADIGEKLTALLDIQDMTTRAGMLWAIGLGMIAVGYTLHGIGAQVRASGISNEISKALYQRGDINTEVILEAVKNAGVKLEELDNRLKRVEKTIKMLGDNSGAGNKN